MNPIDVLGTEECLAKIDGPHTIGFSATYGFNPGSVYITVLAQRQIQMLDSLRLSEEAVSERNLP